MRLSVIIPTFNEAARLPKTLTSLPPDSQVIVSDGQSEDETAAVARDHGAHVVSGPRGRGVQLNAGAREATGDVLLFLHADCSLGVGARDAILHALEDSRVVGGSFRLRIDASSVGLRLVAFGSNARALYLRMPYGDQGLFVRRSAFETVGGYPELPLMEDVALVKRLKRLGRLTPVDVTITTSSRHWEQLGTMGTSMLNWTAVLLYQAGVPPERLAPMYHRLRHRARPLDPVSPVQPEEPAVPMRPKSG